MNGWVGSCEGDFVLLKHFCLFVKARSLKVQLSQLIGIGDQLDSDNNNLGESNMIKEKGEGRREKGVQHD